MIAECTKRIAMSWKELAENIRSGEFGLEVGTRFTDRRADGKKFTVILVHWNGEKKEAVFAFERCPFRCVMNERGTNKGGYRDSDVRMKLETFYEWLPEELQKVIKGKKIVQTIDGEKIKMKDKLFIPSEFQVCGEEKCGKRESSDKEQFEYFKEPINRVRRVEGEKTACYWWESSPNAGYESDFCHVTAAGAAANGDASGAYGVLPCFVIR